MLKSLCITNYHFFFSLLVYPFHHRLVPRYGGKDTLSIKNRFEDEYKKYCASDVTAASC